MFLSQGLLFPNHFIPALSHYSHLCSNTTSLITQYNEHFFPLTLLYFLITEIVIYMFDSLFMACSSLKNMSTSQTGLCVLFTAFNSSTLIHSMNSYVEHWLKNFFRKKYIFFCPSWLNVAYKVSCTFTLMKTCLCSLLVMGNSFLGSRGLVD